MVAYVASVYTTYRVEEVEDVFTLRQIQLLYYLAHKDETKRIASQAKMIAELLGLTATKV